MFDDRKWLNSNWLFIANTIQVSYLRFEIDEWLQVTISSISIKFRLDA